MKAPIFKAHTKSAAAVADTISQLASGSLRKKAEDYQPGQNVQYIQQHAIDSPKREDYDHGQVISIDAQRQEVLVRFIGNGSAPVRCKPHHLK